MKYKFILLSFIFGIQSIGCENKNASTSPDEEPPNSTWGIIQKQILNPNCVDCHTSGTSFAKQSGLVLTEDAAYNQLIDVSPKNTEAVSDGLLRVGSKGLASLDKSYLWEKINVPNREHFYSDHPYYGELMPLGGAPLTNGELNFIKAWIITGAPDTGHVVDAVVLEDTARYEPPEFAPLTRPVNGIQLHLGPFDVAPNFERELFSYVHLNNNEDIYINRIEFTMRSGSHHFILYTFQDKTPVSFVPQPNIIRDIREKNGSYNYSNLLTMRYHTFVSGTQWPLLNYHFPSGVALRLPAGTGLDLNSHYVNRTSETFQGEIYTNIHLVDRTEVDHIAEILFLSNEDILLPAKKTTTLIKTYTFSEKTHIFQLSSHAHEHMTQFNIEIAGGSRNGELIYVAYDWEHPPILDMNPPLVLQPGQGLRLIATYNNQTDRELRFGLLSEDEMMIVFGYYYTD